MMKRSIFLSLAAGLIASVAFAAPAQAGSYQAIFSVTGGPKAADIELFFSAPVTAVTYSSGLTISPDPNLALPSSTVTFNFTPAASGTIDFTTTTAGFLESYTLTGLTGASPHTSLQVNLVPEPASFALLGIGMTGFLAFRRLFKRTAVA